MAARGTGRMAARGTGAAIGPAATHRRRDRLCRHRQMIGMGLLADEIRASTDEKGRIASGAQVIAERRASVRDELADVY